MCGNSNRCCYVRFAPPGNLGHNDVRKLSTTILLLLMVQAPRTGSSKRCNLLHTTRAAMELLEDSTSQKPFPARFRNRFETLSISVVQGPK